MNADTRTDSGAAREACRVAQVAYTAVVDRLTPALTHAEVAANVTRSVTSAGGTPAVLPEVSGAWAPSWQQGAVSVLTEEHTRGPLNCSGTIAFGLTVDVGGTPAAVAATVVLHEPAPGPAADAGVLAASLQAVLAGLRPGADVAVRGREFADRTRSVPQAQLIALVHRGGQFVPAQGQPLAPGDVLLVGAAARTTEGPLLFQTTVLVTDDGAERLDAVPLRLIELR